MAGSYKVSSVMAIVFVVMFMTLMITKIEGLITIGWGTIFIPLWLLYLLLIIMIYDMYQSQRTKGAANSANHFLRMAVFFMVCLLLMQVMIELDLMHSADCREGITVADIRNRDTVDSFCSCNSTAMRDLLAQVVCFWNNDDNIQNNTWNRPVSVEQIYEDYVSQIRCSLRDKVTTTTADVDEEEEGKPVRVEFGAECNRLIPVWFVVTPILAFVLIFFFKTILSRGDRLAPIEVTFPEHDNDDDQSDTDDRYSNDDHEMNPVELTNVSETDGGSANVQPLYDPESSNYVLN